MVGGEILYQDRRFTRVNRDDALRELSGILKRPLSSEEIDRGRLSKAVLPYVRRFYHGYYDSGAHNPYYRQNSRT